MGELLGVERPSLENLSHVHFKVNCSKLWQTPAAVQICHWLMSESSSFFSIQRGEPSNKERVFGSNETFQKDDSLICWNFLSTLKNSNKFKKNEEKNEKNKMKETSQCFSCLDTLDYSRVNV